MTTDLERIARAMHVRLSTILDQPPDVRDLMWALQKGGIPELMELSGKAEVAGSRAAYHSKDWLTGYRAVLSHILAQGDE